MANVRLYRTYRFIDKDPVIDEMRTLLQDEGLIKKLDLVHQLSGVSTSTLENWFNGDTVSPQNRTVSAVATSLGYKRAWEKQKKLDIDHELKLAAAWQQRQNSTRAKTPKKRAGAHHGSNGHHRAGARA